MMQPEMFNGGRWHHIGTDKAARRAIADKNADIIECPAVCMTFVVSLRHLTIVRCSAMGGDTFDVEGAWVYNNDIKLRLDLEEIRSLSKVPVRQ